MKNYSLKPTEENAVMLLQKGPLARNKSVFRFITLLSRLENECYSVALNGAWGSGKTFFVKQVKLILDAYNPQTIIEEEKRTQIIEAVPSELSIPDSYTSVYYDAWANDHHEDPILSLIYATISSGQSDFSPSNQRSICDSVGAIANALTMRDMASVLKSLQGTNCMKQIKEKADLRNLVSDFVDALVEEHGNRLIFFIDELDRCKPDYALYFLERIKHYFDDDRVTFVFSINLSQLQWMVKKYYGQGFDATRYLDKFFDLHITIPDVDYNKFLSARLSLNTSDSRYMAICAQTINYFHFSLREVERYIRLVNIAVNRDNRRITEPCWPEENAIAFSISCFVPIIIGLKMNDLHSYHEFILGKDPTPMLDILCTENTHVFKRFLLNNDERFDIDKGNSKFDLNFTTVSFKERLVEVYHALFFEDYESGYHKIQIGEMEFTAQTHKEIMEIVGLLSSISNYEFE